DVLHRLEEGVRLLDLPIGDLGAEHFAPDLNAVLQGIVAHAASSMSSSSEVGAEYKRVTPRRRRFLPPAGTWESAAGLRRRALANGPALAYRRVRLRSLRPTAAHPTCQGVTVTE